MADISTNKTFVGIAAALVAVGAGVAVMIRGQRSKQAPSLMDEKETWESHVDESHGALEEIFPGVLYRLEAPGCDMGPPIRNMVIYRVPSNNTKPRRLVIISAIAVRDDTLQDILELGTPAVMIVPNHMHRCCAGVWQRKFPDMKVVCVGASCPANSRSKMEEIVQVDMTTEELTQTPEYKDWIAVKKIDGWAHFEEIIEVKLTNHKKAMIVCDLLFTMPYDKDARWFHWFILRLFDSCIVLPEDPTRTMVVPKVSRVARIFGIQDWTKAEQWYRNYAEQEGPKIFAILVGHGVPVVELDPTKGCTEALLGVAEQLVKPRW